MAGGSTPHPKNLKVYQENNWGTTTAGGLKLGTSTGTNLVFANALAPVQTFTVASLQGNQG